MSKEEERLRARRAYLATLTSLERRELITALADYIERYGDHSSPECVAIYDALVPGVLGADPPPLPRG